MSLAVFAETNFRNQRRKFGVKTDDRRRHMYIVGKTSMGKSTLLENMIINDIRAGNGVAVVDPHGDMADKIMQFVPNERINDVIYFNPADTQFPIAFNILESVGPEYKHLVAYGLVGVFKKIWADSWGPRMEYIMTNTILALLDYPGSTLLGVMRMLVDKTYRKKVVAKVTDPVIKTFWADEFANYSEKFRTEAIAPIQNKVGQFLASSIIRNIVGQSKSTIEMRKIMDDQKILIMNLSKGRVGEENSALLGAMMITKLQIAAMSRVDIPEEERKDFYLYVDEFQNFATDSFAGILSEARKYRLCLIMAHQYFEQLNDLVKAAVFGNVGTMLIFRVGATDAAELELEFAPQFTPADIVNLKKYTFCIRLMVDGVATEPFSAIGLPPVSGTTDNHEKAIRISRERYARPQNLVEDRIIRWSGVEVARPAGATVGVSESSAEAVEGEGIAEEMGEEESQQEAALAAETAKLSSAAQPIVIAPPALSVDVSKLIPEEGGRVPQPVQFSAISQAPAAARQIGEQAPPTISITPTTPTRSRPKIDFVRGTQPKPTLPETASVMVAPVLAAPSTTSQPTVKQSKPRSMPAPAIGQSSSSPNQPVSRTAGVGTTQDTGANKTISLRDLQTGAAPQVSFKAERQPIQPTNQPVPGRATSQVTTSAASPVGQGPGLGNQGPVAGSIGRGQGTITQPSMNVAGNFSGNVADGSFSKKRRRRRKRRPGDGQQPSQGQPSQSPRPPSPPPMPTSSSTYHQPSPPTSPPQSPQSPRPSPVVGGQRQTSPSLSQPSPSSPSTTPPDHTKVSLQDLFS